MGSVLWLFIDKKSMLTALLLAQLSQLISMIRTRIFSVAPSIPFSGISVILIGNLHQFPPVASTNKELYNANPSDELSQLGCTLFEQFDTIVHLNQQM
jgi:hypothetical protein